MIISSKQEFYRLWTAGVLGNRLRSWVNLEEALASEVQQFALRETGVAGGGQHIFSCRQDLPGYYRLWLKTVPSFFIAEAAEHHLQTLHGEICRTYRGLEGYLGRSTLPMRDAMRFGFLKPRSGTVVRALLNRFVDPSSIDDLEMLLELYPDATIEFSSFTKDVGCIPGRNTVIWEVRNY